MIINNNGNIKLVSLLFILGASSAVLLIPAVVQKENQIQQNNVKGKFDNKVSEETNPIIQTYETIKREYIEVPIERVVETTKEITKVVTEPITSTKPAENFISQTINLTNPLSYILGDSTKTETEPSPKINEPMVKVTKEMVDNCKIITEEYNKKTK